MVDAAPSGRASNATVGPNPTRDTAAFSRSSSSVKARRSTLRDAIGVEARDNRHVPLRPVAARTPNVDHRNAGVKKVAGRYRARNNRNLRDRRLNRGAGPASWAGRVERSQSPCVIPNAPFGRGCDSPPPAPTGSLFFSSSGKAAASWRSVSASSSHSSAVKCLSCSMLMSSAQAPLRRVTHDTKGYLSQSLSQAQGSAKYLREPYDTRSTDAVHSRTSYSNATPSGSFSFNHALAASLLAKTFR